MYPPVPLIARTLDEDVVIHGYRLPAGVLSLSLSIVFPLSRSVCTGLSLFLSHCASAGGSSALPDTAQESRRMERTRCFPARKVGFLLFVRVCVSISTELSFFDIGQVY